MVNLIDDGDNLGAAEVLPFVASDLKKIAARVIEKAKEVCASKSVWILALPMGVTTRCFTSTVWINIWKLVLNYG